MKNLILSKGVRTFRIDLYNCSLTKKPISRITCIEDNGTSCEIDEDNYFDREIEDASYYPSIEEIDTIIQKLKQAKRYMKGNINN